MHLLTVGEWDQVCSYFDGETVDEEEPSEPPVVVPSSPPSLVIVG